MSYLFWVLPAILVVGLIASGRMGALPASILGLSSALLVALTTAPTPFLVGDAFIAMARGSWIGWTVVPYILGGLLFWQVAVKPAKASIPGDARPLDSRAKRRLLFSACFLIGPFAESATGFGIGIIGTMTLVRRLDVATVHLLAFSLISQTMILWGGMGSGAIVAAAFARTNPTTLAVHTSMFLVVFNALWLPCYWRMADRAGIAGDWTERLSEAAWLGVSLAGVIGATALLGPETAMLTSYGPMILLRWIVDERPDRRTLRAAARQVAPFAILIGWLVFTRLVPPVTHVLEGAGRIQPFAGAPPWSPLFHAGTWLVVAAIVTGLFRGHATTLGREAMAAWKTGRLAVLTIITFAMMAEVLSGSGIARGLAQGVFAALDRWALVATTLASALFGSLANSANAANGLFIASQLSLATDAGLSGAAVTALQNASALSLSMVSPVRMSIVCGLAGTPGMERDVYRAMMPFTAVIVVTLVTGSLLIALRFM